MSVEPIPAGYHSVTPYLVCSGAARALDFYAKAFGAEELMRMPGPDGKVMHAEFRIGNSPIMISDESLEMGFKSPATLGGAGVSLMIYVKDCDAVFGRAVASGAKVRKPLADQFYGDRSGNITDPFGHSWTIATHVEDVAPAEMERRMQEVMKTGQPG